MGRGRIKRNAVLDNGVTLHSESNNLKRNDNNTECEKDSSSWNKNDAVFVVEQCLISRCYLFLAQFLFNLLFSDFPADAFLGIPSDDKDYFLDRCINLAFSGLAKWDSVHFLHIAENGYTFENSLAFFPLFPSVVYFLSLLWSWMVPFLSFSSALLVTAVSVNLVAFVINGQLLYALLLSLTKSRERALIGCIIFSFNPSSIFFSAAYSESLYFMFTLCGMLFLYTKWVPSTARYYLSACIFAFAFLTRSNGVLNFGYIAYHLLLELFYCPMTGRYLWEDDTLQIVLKTGRIIYIGMVCFGLLSSLVMLNTSRMYDLFCNVHSRSFYARVPNAILKYARNHNLVVPGEVEKLSWCRSNRSFYNPLPIFYAPIQKKYWDVEFLGYWQLKKLPNFIVAAPTLILVAVGIFQFMRYYYESNLSLVKFLTSCLRGHYKTLPIVLHATALSLSGLLIYNVEVVTRILFSSSPFLYLVLSEYMHSKTPLVTVEDIKLPRPLPFLTNFCRTHFLHRLLLCYLLGYFFIGTALHVNWLPFV